METHWRCVYCIIILKKYEKLISRGFWSSFFSILLACYLNFKWRKTLHEFKIFHREIFYFIPRSLFIQKRAPMFLNGWNACKHAICNMFNLIGVFSVEINSTSTPKKLTTANCQRLFDDFMLFLRFGVLASSTGITISHMFSDSKNFFKMSCMEFARRLCYPWTCPLCWIVIFFLKPQKRKFFETLKKKLIQNSVEKMHLLRSTQTWKTTKMTWGLSFEGSQ